MNVAESHDTIDFNKPKTNSIGYYLPYY